MKVKIKEFIKPLLKEVRLSYEKKFNIYWSGISKTEKIEFLESLAKKYLESGVPMSDVSTNICKDLERSGLLGMTLSRKYMPNEYKNKEMQQNKLGKTYEVSGKISKEYPQQKTHKLEIENTKLQLENLKLQKHILELNEVDNQN